MYNNEGMTWFNKLNKLAGFTNRKTYHCFVNEEGVVIFVSLYSDEMEWWPAHIYKTVEEIEYDKAEKAKLENIHQCMKERTNIPEPSRNRYFPRLANPKL
jgi:hypothetical protein